MKQFLMIIIIIIIFIYINNFIVKRTNDKIIANTYMRLLNDIAVLSDEAGYKSWVEYMEIKYGKENSIYYLNQLYKTTKRFKSDNEEYNILSDSLKSYIKTINN